MSQFPPDKVSYPDKVGLVQVPTLYQMWPRERAHVGHSWKLWYTGKDLLTSQTPSSWFLGQRAKHGANITPSIKSINQKTDLHLEAIVKGRKFPKKKNTNRRNQMKHNPTLEPVDVNKAV